MPKSPNQKMKLLYLARLMLEETDGDHKLTMKRIIEKLAEYGISAERKSVYDDFEALRSFGIDIESDGRNGGYYVAEREFEIPELKLLVDAVQSSRFITQKKSRELIGKIERLTSRHTAMQLQRQVHVTNRIKTMNESIYYSVDSINNAISMNEKISFRYFDFNENKEKVFRHDGKTYIISPWALMWDDRNYYMVAYDSENRMTKHYRVDKMCDINHTGEPREGAESLRDFDAALYAKKTFSMFGGEETLVTLRCKNAIAGKIIDRFGLDINFIKAGDDRFDFSVRVAVSPVFLTWLMNFIGDIEIISPENVIQKYKQLAKSALDFYGESLT